MRHRLKSGLRSASIIIVAAFSLFASFAQIQPAHTTAATATSKAARVSFTFDDGFVSSLTQAAPVLAKYGYAGTNYVIPGCVGKGIQLCAGSTNGYLSWEQVVQLQNHYGWEIGGHSMTHPLMTTISDEQKLSEVRESYNAFVSRGIQPVSFATPYGDYDPAVQRSIAQYYESHRGFWDIGYNTWPNDDMLIRVQQVQLGTSVSKVRQYIDAAAANGTWLVLVFHDIKPRTNRNDAYSYSTSNLDAIASYVKQKKLPVVRMKEGIVKGDINQIPNGSFENGFEGGWSSDVTENVSLDRLMNGNATGRTSAVLLRSSAQTAHLYAPRTAVTSTQSYLYKSYLDIRSVAVGGEISYYIDEYDALGNWISGQWKTARSAISVSSVNISYTPSSPAVVSARLQLSVNGSGTGTIAYADGFQMYSLSGTAAPSPTPTSTPTPTPLPSANLLANGEFIQGLSAGWRTDKSDVFMADNTGKGAPTEQQHSVAFGSSSENAHLFSPLVSIDPSKSYTQTSYLRLTAIQSGEIGYYIDEYDALGNWISGQWKRSVSTLGGQTVSLQYQASSASVRRISIQFIVPGSSMSSGYIDAVTLTLN